MGAKVINLFQLFKAIHSPYKSLQSFNDVGLKILY